MIRSRLSTPWDLSRSRPHGVRLVVACPRNNSRSWKAYGFLHFFRVLIIEHHKPGAPRSLSNRGAELFHVGDDVRAVDGGRLEFFVGFKDVAEDFQFDEFGHRSILHVQHHDGDVVDGWAL